MDRGNVVRSGADHVGKVGQRGYVVGGPCSILLSIWGID